MQGVRPWGTCPGLLTYWHRAAPRHAAPSASLRLNACVALWWSCRLLLQFNLIVNISGGERQTGVELQLIFLGPPLSSWVLVLSWVSSTSQPNQLKATSSSTSDEEETALYKRPPPLPQFHTIPTINPLFHIIRVICFSDFGIEDEYYYNKTRKHVALALGPAVKETWRALRKLLAETWLAGRRWGFKEERPARNYLNYPQLIECSRWEHWYCRA